MNLQKEIEYLEGIKDRPGNDPDLIRNLIKEMKDLIRLRPLYSKKRLWFISHKKHKELRNATKEPDQIAIEALESLLEDIKRKN